MSIQSSERISPLQYLVSALCFLTILIDGFDTQSVAFAGPLLRREFGGGPQALGLIFGLGMFGGLLGGTLLGPLGDRFGRRPLVHAALIGGSAQLSVTTITARLNPNELRATGTGWAFGFGRVGGVAGPIFAGLLLGAGMNFATMMATLGGLMLVAGFAVLCLGRARKAGLPRDLESTTRRCRML